MSPQPTPSIVPIHLGIIPDGNRRWAKMHGKMTVSGHRKGLDVAKAMCYASFQRGVKVLSMYSFSTENWNRAQEEVGYLMELFYSLVTDELAELDRNNVRLCFLGSEDRVSDKLLKAIKAAELKTRDNDGGILALCLNYGGEQEIADAATKLIAGGHQGPVTPSDLAAHMYAPDIPPVDLIIRTSGEHRTSGFMLWRAAYAEFFFTNKHWPDFTSDDLDAAFTDYAARQRRFGA